MAAQLSDPFLFPKTAQALVTSSGDFFVARICEPLGVTKADFGRLTGRGTESVAKMFRDAPVSPHEDKTRRVLRELIQLQGILGVLGLAEGEAMAVWMNTPLPAFDGKTPKEVVGAGHGQRLIARLMAHASGNVSA